MEILAVLISTGVISYAMPALDTLTYLKKLAFEGYKVDLFKLKQVMDSMFPNEQKEFYQALPWPGFNLINTCGDSVAHENKFVEITKELDQIGGLIPMDETECRIFLRKPNSITALNLCMGSDEEPIKKVETKKSSKVIKK